MKQQLIELFNEYVTEYQPYMSDALYKFSCKYDIEVDDMKKLLMIAKNLWAENPKR